MKKAFTLIEMLAILLILAILSLILIPTVKNALGNAKNNAYESQVNIIENAAEKYFMDSEYNIDGSEKKVIYLADIIKAQYIDNDKVINPIDEKEMTGCVLVSMYSNQYHFQYLDTISKLNIMILF